jgi:octaprenyl-diphosphate synthase
MALVKIKKAPMISSTAPLPFSSPSLAPLASLLAPQLDAINACILQRMQSSVELIPQIAGYLISLGGKRLRPLLTIASAELCGYEGDRHIPLAACIEFIHTATLLHDDVVDESTLRRGKATANALWGNKVSILVGDFLFSRAFELMVEDGSLTILKILSETTSTLAEGEILQLTSSHDLKLTPETYLKIIGAKTARLFSAATEVGAVIADADDSQRKALSHFGYCLGMAFQLMDDVLDYTANPEKLGKAVGDDFREGNITLPVILAYEKGADQSVWEHAFKEGIRDDKALAYAISLLKKSGALLKTQKIAQGFVHEALGCLHLFPESPLKEALCDVTHFSIHREG